MKQFNITGKIEFEVDIDIEAETEEEALEIAKEDLLDYYHLDVHGANHDPEDVEIELDIEEYEDED